MTPQSTSKNHQKTITRRRPQSVGILTEFARSPNQSGLSMATVDRVLNERGNVRASTVREVQQAIADLDRQREQVRLVGQTFTVDVVMSAPERFSTAVRDALEAELAFLRPALIRCRFHLKESASLVGRRRATRPGPSSRLARRGGEGSRRARGRDAIDRLESAGIPVVTLVTDVPTSRRRAYVGMDNRAAGQTAAYLMSQWASATAAERRPCGAGDLEQQRVPWRGGAREWLPGGAA